MAIVRLYSLLGSVAAGCAIAGSALAAPATRPTVTENVTDAKGLDYALDKLKAPMRETDPLPPGEALKRFKLQPGLAVDLIAAEPDIRQPLCINFDERGRMWVVQYIQYPFPAGLKVVEYDKYIRAKFDKVPDAPPNHTAGKDVVSILEDADGNGTVEKVKTFVGGLSIATSALPGRGGRGKDDYGVWVMNAPYLLFYPDKNRDDVPDGDPIVHLSGFGIEDTHAVASNLTWGPDGWLYGTQGSTCTAKVKAHLSGSDKTTDFLGQAIWRYHPERHTFEIFAEGGGNTFGLEFDDDGNAFSGTNWGKYRGLHYVQGGYYVKGWGKHGPLTNPYAYGYFEHMPHEGNADRLAHTFVVYGGTLFPDWRGKIISPNSLQSRVQMTKLVPNGSTFRTVEEPFIMTSEDGWFRPVDLKVGPDGAIYVADMYEKRISHVDPRDTWERGNGRIWRIRPENWKPSGKKFDLWEEPADSLVKRLMSTNRWERAMARRVIADRALADAKPLLLELLNSNSKQAQLEALWALHTLGATTEEALKKAIMQGDRLAPTESVVLAWCVRLAADEVGWEPKGHLVRRLAWFACAPEDYSIQLRTQLAASARRMAPDYGSVLAWSLIDRSTDADASDPHLPLLLWWAVEQTTVKSRDFNTTKSYANSDSTWERRIARETIFPRLARRLAAEATAGNQKMLRMLLTEAPGDAERAILVAGIKEALAGGGPVAKFEPELVAVLAKAGDIELSLRLGDATAEPAAMKRAADESVQSAKRILLIGALGQSGKSSGPDLLTLAQNTKKKDVRVAAITALPRFESGELATGLAAWFPIVAKEPDSRSAIITTLLARPAWAVKLVEAVAAGTIAKADLSAADLERLRQFDDPAVVAAVEKVFGKPVRATGEEKLRETERVKRLVTTGAGDATAGKALFATRCGTCHTLFGEGGKVGPELTGYDRRNLNDMVVNVVDPSAYIREEFANFRVKTKGGESYIGLITERAADRLGLVDAAGQRIAIAKADVDDERPLTVSLMPEGLLAGLSDQQVRDLYKYLSAEAPKPGK
jgi:putative membrane-bound dehydrogenase-like protein